MPKQQKVLAALLTEPTLTAAVVKVNVGERTVHTWLGEPIFGQRLPPKGGQLCPGAAPLVHPDGMAGLQPPGGRYCPPRSHRHGQCSHTMCSGTELEPCGWPYRNAHTWDTFGWYCGH